ncbi:MAG TPA: zinc-ribbon domain-containing protein [Mycobacteriales bacterium]|nr:zinc-ribbon domain-containing protein [Mycobacteriales bacterium]
MIIFGLAVFFFGSVEQGVFHCPNCGGDREYKRKIGRRWFTLFFVPVIPLNKVAEVVQCGTCNTRYQPSVLSVPTTGQLAAAVPAAVAAAASLVLRAAAPSMAARARAIEAVRLAGSANYGDPELDAELAQPPAAVLQRLAEAGGPLAPEARERILAEATRVGLADGPLTAEERQALGAVGPALSLTAAQFYGTVSMVEQSAPHS